MASPQQKAMSTTPQAKGPWPWKWQTTTSILLRSKEGYEYEIDEDVLVRGSNFFRTLFSPPNSIANQCFTDLSSLSVSTPAPHLAEVIEMDMSFVDLKLFARLMVQIVRCGRYTCPQYIKINLNEADNLFPLIKKYDCTRMQDCVRQRVLYLAKDQPWEVLIMACRMDDIPMAQVAISHLSGSFIHTTDSHTPDNSLWQHLGKLSGPWALEFIRLYMPATLESRCPMTYRTYVGAIMRDDFGTWAKDFNPGRRI